MTQALNFFVHPVLLPMMAMNGLLTNLTAWWELDEASGATRVDSHSTNDLTNNGTVGQATGPGGSNAADFPGTSGNYLNITDNPELSMADIDFTLACWAYLDSLSGTQILTSKGSSAGNQTQEWQLYLASSVFQLTVGNNATSGTVASTVSLSTATWYFLTAWHDSVNNQLGIRVNTGTPNITAYSSGSFNSTFEMAVGRWSNFNGGYVDGRMAKLGIWKNRVLSGADSALLYNVGNGLTYADLTT